MNNSQNTTPTNCFSSVLRRLLCTGGLPTHPSSDSNNLHEPTTDSSDSTHLLFKPSSSIATTTPAGIVVRLMGLDSFPNSLHTTKEELGTILRSRSVNSLDLLPKFDATKNRRVRTSVSFREVPTFLQTSRNHGKSEVGFTPKEEKSKTFDMGIGKERARVNAKVMNEESKKNTKKKVQSLKAKAKSEEEVCRRERRENATKKKVLDDEFQDDRRKFKSRNRRYNHPLPKRTRVEKKSTLKRRESEYSNEYCVKVLVEVCRLTREETEGGVWMDKKEVNGLQEISYEVGQEMLQMLLCETVHELCIIGYNHRVN